jgi:hypothetical protein
MNFHLPIQSFFYEKKSINKKYNKLQTNEDVYNPFHRNRKQEMKLHI